MDSKKISKLLSKTELTNIIELHGGVIVEINNPSVYIAFKLRKSMVTLYNNGTLLVQGSDSDEVRDFVLNIEITPKQDLEKFKEAYLPTFKVTTRYEIGTDEVGVGDYFGGLTACAALIDHHNMKDIQSLGITDSKDLDDAQIKKIAAVLQNKITYAIAHVEPAEYNELFEKFQNSHIIKTYLHNKALVSILDQSKLKRDECQIVMDQFASSKAYYKYLNTLNAKKTVKIDAFETKGEQKFLSIAAASILARNHWLNKMEELEAKIELPVFFGASNKKILLVAEKIYQRDGIKGLKDAVKLHFCFTDKIIKRS